MNRSVALEVAEGAILDQVLFTTRMALDIAWRFMIAALAIAILLGMVAGPGARSEKSPLKEQQPVRVAGEGNKYRVYTHIAPEEESLHLELIDPVGKQHLHLAYNKKGLAYFFTQQANRFRLGYVVRPGGNEIASVSTPAANYSCDLLSNGESGVVVKCPSGLRRTLGEIWITPEGKRRPPRDHDE